MLCCCFIQDNRTALHWACSAGHADIVQFLLELGVDVNIEDDVSQHCFMMGHSKSLIYCVSECYWF